MYSQADVITLEQDFGELDILLFVKTGEVKAATSVKFHSRETIGSPIRGIPAQLQVNTCCGQR